MNEILDVLEFQIKFKFPLMEKPTQLTLNELDEQYNCLREELEEFSTAAADGDFPGQADALVDLVYFALGAALKMGLPWQELWNDVHRANMAKVPGVTHRGHVLDVTKPAGWVPPQTFKILKEAGYEEKVQESTEVGHPETTLRPVGEKLG